VAVRRSPRAVPSYYGEGAGGLQASASAHALTRRRRYR